MFFFFNDTATTEIYTLSLHDALPISFTHRPLVSHFVSLGYEWPFCVCGLYTTAGGAMLKRDFIRDGNRSIIGSVTTNRKSTRLNSSHQIISYAVFCLKKKKKDTITT